MLPNIDQVGSANEERIKRSRGSEAAEKRVQMLKARLKGRAWLAATVNVFP
jgi:hypothetical protein